jgi:DNA-binding HxlR family transcriptional regulator
MKRTRFDQDQCAIARTADLLGEWWMPLVVRELLFGRTRFNDLQEQLDINRTLLTARRERLETEGVIQRHRYNDRPPRDEFVLTDKGRALWDVLGAMATYGGDWLFEKPSEIEFYNKTTGQTVRPEVIDHETGEPLDITRTRRRLTASGPASEMEA